MPMASSTEPIINVTCYTDETIVNITLTIKVIATEKRHYFMIPMPVDAHNFSVTSKQVCVVLMESVRIPVQITTTHGEVLIDGHVLRNQPYTSDTAADAASVAVLQFPGTWHAFHSRDIIVTGEAAESKLHVVLEPSSQFMAKGGPLPKEFTFTITFHMPHFKWSFFHELHVELPTPVVGTINTMIRLDGAHDLFIAWLATARIREVNGAFPVAMSFINQRLNAGDTHTVATQDRAMRFKRSGGIDAHDEVVDMFERGTAGRWTIDQVMLRPGGIERTLKAISMDIPLALFNVYEARVHGSSMVSPETRILFDKEQLGKEKRALIEPGRLSVHDTAGGMLLRDHLSLGPRQNMINVGPIPWLKVSVNRTLDNKAEAYHEEVVHVMNSFGKDSVIHVHVVQRGASRVEILSPPARTLNTRTSYMKEISTVVTALQPKLLDLNDENNDSGVSNDAMMRARQTVFIIPVEARQGETIVQYRWYETSNV
jgi:hypothetical protein